MKFIQKNEGPHGFRQDEGVGKERQNKEMVRKMKKTASSCRKQAYFYSVLDGGT
jgi:hypothetical protein